MSLCVHRDVVAAIEEACRIYNETISIIKNIITREFEKFLVVADPGNEMNFMEFSGGGEFIFHFSCF